MAIFTFCVIGPDCIFIVHVIKKNICSCNYCSALLLKIWVVELFFFPRVNLHFVLLPTISVFSAK